VSCSGSRVKTSTGPADLIERILYVQIHMKWRLAGAGLVGVETYFTNDSVHCNVASFHNQKMEPKVSKPHEFVVSILGERTFLEGLPGGLP